MIEVMTMINFLQKHDDDKKMNKVDNDDFH